MLLLILASVQFTSIVDFMVVMPWAGIVLKTGHYHQTVWLDRRVLLHQRGIAGVLASSIMDRFGRKTAFLTLYVGLPFGTLFCGLAAQSTYTPGRPRGDRLFRRNPGWPGTHDRGRHVPRGRRGQATGVLMSAFVVASVVGVPAGLYVGLSGDGMFRF